MRAALALACASLAAAQNPGGISGTVQDSVSHLPVRKAQVMLTSRGMMPAAAPLPGPALTDASGGFAFRGLPPGAYDLQIHHPRYPEPRLGLARQAVTVKAGEETRVAAELTPGAAVAGRVLDEDGDPIAGCMVQPGIPGNERQGVAFLGAEPSDESGQYRIWGIPAGTYLLAVNCRRPLFQPRPLSAGPPPPPSLAYPTQFYPLAGDLQGAQAVELAPGTEKSGMDFRLSPARVYTVRGRITSTGGDWRDRNDLMLTLMPRGGGPLRAGDRRRLVDREKGTFEFQSVFPGAYILIAFTRGEPGARMGARQELEVSDRPLEVNLELRPAAEVSGTVEVADGRKPPPGMQVQLHSAEVFGQLDRGAPVREDGTFAIPGVTPARFSIRVFAPNLFVQSVWAGGRELPGRTLDTGTQAGPLRIVLSGRTATIRGTGPPGELVRIIYRSGEEQFISGIPVNPQGEFSLGGLAPGRYTVALGGEESGGDQEGRQVTLAEGETATVDLKPPAAP